MDDRIDSLVTLVLLGALQVLMVIGCASSTYPEISEDGLIKIAQTRFDVLYEEPAVDLRSYRKFVVEECTVTFRDNWQRDQNQDREPARRVTGEHMSRIAQTLATSCRDILVDELGKIEDLEVVAGSGADVLALRTSIVDLDIAAPDIQSAGRHRAYTTSAGSMNLHLELVDSSTGMLVGQVIDRWEAAETYRLQRATAVSNMVEADRLLRRWASQVSEYVQTGAE